MDGAETTQPIFTTVDSLLPGTSGHNLVVKVVSSSVQVSKTRVDGTKITVAEVLVGDATGCVILSARNAQVPLCKPGVCLTLRNAKIDMFQGCMRLAVDKWGKLAVSDTDPVAAVNDRNNVSLLEFELVGA